MQSVKGVDLFNVSAPPGITHRVDENLCSLRLAGVVLVERQLYLVRLGLLETEGAGQLHTLHPLGQTESLFDLRSSGATGRTLSGLSVNIDQLNVHRLPVQRVGGVVLVSDHRVVVHGPVDLGNSEGERGAFKHLHEAEASPRSLAGDIAGFPLDHLNWRFDGAVGNLSLKQEIIQRSSEEEVLHLVTPSPLHHYV